MTQPWSERQRTALRSFREAVSVRARREQEIATGTAERTREAEEQFHAAKEMLRESLAAAQTEAAAKYERSRQQVDQHHEEAKQKADADFAVARHSAVREYLDNKRALQGEFEEARWTINTVYDSDK